MQSEAAHCNQTFNNKLQYLKMYNESYKRARLCQYVVSVFVSMALLFSRTTSRNAILYLLCVYFVVYAFVFFLQCYQWCAVVYKCGPENDSEMVSKIVVAWKISLILYYCISLLFLSIRLRSIIGKTKQVKL